MDMVNCPTISLSVPGGGTVYKEFDQGCEGNVASADGPTNTLMATIGVFATVLIIIIVVWTFRVWRNYDDVFYFLSDTAIFGCRMLLAGFAVILYTQFAKMEPIAQCNPLPASIYSDGLDWNPPFSYFSDGCFWDIPDWSSVEWVESILPICPNAAIDFSTNQYQPMMWVRSVASPLVLRTIEETTDQLRTIMYVVIVVAMLDIAFYIHRQLINTGCYDCCCNCCSRKLCARCGVEIEASRAASTAVGLSVSVSLSAPRPELPTLPPLPPPSPRPAPLTLARQPVPTAPTAQASFYPVYAYPQ